MRLGVQMDKILAKGLCFRGCHGVLAQEKIIPQKFIIDLEMDTDFTQAVESDDISRTVDYSEVYNEIRQIIEEQSFNLLETLANYIATRLLEKFNLQAVELTLYKPEAPVEGVFDYFAVKIKRNA